MGISRVRFDDRDGIVVRSQAALIVFFILTGFITVLKRNPQSTTSGFIHGGIAAVLGGVFFIPRRHRPVVQLSLLYLLASLFGALGAVDGPEASILLVIIALYTKRYGVLARYRGIALAFGVLWFLLMIVTSWYHRTPSPSPDRSLLDAIHYTLFWAVIVYLFIIAGYCDGRGRDRHRFDEMNATGDAESAVRSADTLPLSAQLRAIARIAGAYEGRWVVPGRILSEVRVLAEAGLDRLSSARELIFNPDSGPDSHEQASSR